MKPRKPRISRAAASDDALAQLAEIERQARAAIAAQDRDEYTLGVLWNRLAAGGWTRKAKLGSPKSWWREHIPDEVDVRMAEMFGRLARAFSQEVVERYHATSLDLYLRYCKKEGVTPPADPGKHLIQVPRGDRYVGKTFDSCTRQELRDAIKGVPAAPKKAPDPLPDADQARVEAVQRALQPFKAAHPELQFSAQMRGPRPLYSLTEVDGYVLPAVLAAVQKAV